MHRNFIRPWNSMKWQSVPCCEASLTSSKNEQRRPPKNNTKSQVKITETRRLKLSLWKTNLIYFQWGKKQHDLICWLKNNSKRLKLEIIKSHKHSVKLFLMMEIALLSFVVSFIHFLSLKPPLLLLLLLIMSSPMVMAKKNKKLKSRKTWNVA